MVLVRLQWARRNSTEAAEAEGGEQAPRARIAVARCDRAKTGALKQQEEGGGVLRGSTRIEGGEAEHQAGLGLFLALSTAPLARQLPEDLGSCFGLPVAPLELRCGIQDDPQRLGTLHTNGCKACCAAMLGAPCCLRLNRWLRRLCSGFRFLCSHVWASMQSQAAQGPCNLRAMDRTSTDWLFSTGPS